jgi:hypothetical protein
MVGERGFEPPTPWSRTNNRCTNLLYRLGLFCVLYRLSVWFSGANGPKLDPPLEGTRPSRKDLQLGTALCFWPRRHRGGFPGSTQGNTIRSKGECIVFLTTVTNQLSDERFSTKWIVSGLPVIRAQF